MINEMDFGSLAAIDIEGVNVNYGGNIVLEQITLKIKQREIFAIIGPNGGGKTTLLRVILGLTQADEGRVTIFGQLPKVFSKGGSISYLPQQGKYLANFPIRVFDVVAMPIRVNKKRWQKLTKLEMETISHALHNAGLSGNKQKYFQNLSGGQKQRALLARAMVSYPRLLVLDEPSTGLDIRAKEDFYNLLATFRNEFKVTIVFVSHDIAAVSGVVDRLAFLNQSLHFYGPPQDFLSPENLNQGYGSRIYYIDHDHNCPNCLGYK